MTTREIPDHDLRAAASIVLLRSGVRGPEVLTGRRGAGAAVLPDRRVFPGGSVDRDDSAIPFARPLGPVCARRLGAEGEDAAAFAACAIRELWEETGLALGRPGCWPGTPPAGWDGFAALGLLPDAGALVHVFRAITPRNEPRRFDARFFVALADGIGGKLGHLPGGGEVELEDLRWQPLAEVDRDALAFITEVVLAEAAEIARQAEPAPPALLPMFENRRGLSAFLHQP